MPILTSKTGTNADVFPDILRLYLPLGSHVLDMTWGRGVFWRRVPKGDYRLVCCDKETKADVKADLGAMPFPAGIFDSVILDPPYMHGGASVKASINDCYRNRNGSHESVVRLYGRGVLEAARLLRQGGTLIVKCQDEIESGKQRLTHVEIVELLGLFGFFVLDLFILTTCTTPAMREKYQKSARKNHSYFIVGKFRR